MKGSKKIPYTVYVILCVVLLLLLLSGIGYITGFNSDSNRRYKNDNIVFHNSTAKRVEFPTDNIANIKIDCGYGKIKIQTTSEQSYIEYAKDSSFTTETYTSGDQLEIKLKFDSKFWLRFVNNLFEDHLREAIIYLPEKMLDKVTIVASANQLFVEDINATKLEMRISAGDVFVENCNISEFQSELNAGNFEFYANNGIAKINSKVNAGNMKLFLPRDIAGFACNYDIDLGNIDNNMNFEIVGSDETHFVSRKGSFDYGDKSCEIQLNVSVGNIILEDYR